MSVLDRLRGTPTEPLSEVHKLSKALRNEQDQNLLLEERLLTLEQQLSEPGWAPIDGAGQGEFSRGALRKITALSRLNAIKNPLIRRAINVRLFYVWGQGVQIAAADETVNDVVQEFINDPGNQAALFGQQAREAKDRSLHTDGNLFLALFTHPRTGRVQVRDISFDEIVDIVRDPDDRTNVWFYKRTWRQTVIDEITGASREEERTAYYPDFRYQPLGRGRRRTIGGDEVRWFEPVMHVRDGGLDGWRFGLSLVYPVLDWARAYKEFLEDWAAIVRALSRYAYKAKTSAKKTAAMRRSLGDANELNADGSRKVAGTFTSDEASDLVPVPKSGATVDAESGRPLAMMVSAGMDVPYTILMGDADMGNLATAKTLDRPTELAMMMRQQMWGTYIRQLCDYVVDRSVQAPQGVLRGTVTRDEYDRLVVELADEADRTVSIDWPSILEHDVVELVKAIKAADDTEQIPDEVITRLLLVVLGVEDIDEIMDSLRDDEGNFVGAGARDTASAGQAAVDAFRAGEDPVALLR